MELQEEIRTDPVVTELYFSSRIPKGSSMKRRCRPVM